MASGVLLFRASAGFGERGERGNRGSLTGARKCEHQAFGRPTGKTGREGQQTGSQGSPGQPVWYLHNTEAPGGSPGSPLCISGTLTGVCWVHRINERRALHLCTADAINERGCQTSSQAQASIVKHRTVISSTKKHTVIPITNSSL